MKNGRIHDFLNLWLISQIDPNSGTIQSMAKENTLTTGQSQHHVQKNSLGSLKNELKARH